MSGTEQVINIGEPMPRLASVACHGAYEIVVGWAAGSPRERSADLIDLAPLILAHKLYKPLRDNPDLFKTVHTIAGGSAIAWGDDDAIDMAATSIERLAEERMTSVDFRAWLQSHKLTYDAAAAQLGVSRRLVAYYADQRPVPRYIALACRYLDQMLAASRGEVGPMATVEVGPVTVVGYSLPPHPMTTGGSTVIMEGTAMAPQPVRPPGFAGGGTGPGGPPAPTTGRPGPAPTHRNER